jgi:hypothetical protein
MHRCSSAKLRRGGLPKTREKRREAITLRAPQHDGRNESNKKRWEQARGERSEAG